MGPGESKVVHRKACPQCGEQVPVMARICHFCRHEFEDEADPSDKAPTTFDEWVYSRGAATAREELRQDLRSGRIDRPTHDKEQAAIDSMKLD